MKDFLIASFVVFFIFYMFVGTVTTFVTSIDQAEGLSSNCQNLYKYDYVFPFRKLGCYLGEEVNEKTSKKSCQTTYSN